MTRRLALGMLWAWRRFSFRRFSMQAANNVMVLYTGGTIGMQASANGLAPASGFEARMREQLANQPVPTWRFREMSPLIDSANMTPAYWQRLRTAVVEAVDEGCDAVLILHGTDTLAYSAAAMSFPTAGPAGAGGVHRLDAAGRRTRQRCLGKRQRRAAGPGPRPGAGRAPVLPRRADGADPLRESPQLRAPPVRRVAAPGRRGPRRVDSCSAGLPPAQGPGQCRRAAVGAGYRRRANWTA